MVDYWISEVYAELDEARSKSVRIHSVHIQQIHRDARIAAMGWLSRLREDLRDNAQMRWS